MGNSSARQLRFIFIISSLFAIATTSADASGCFTPLLNALTQIVTPATCTPVIDGQHLSVQCLETNNLVSLATPEFSSPCGRPLQIDQEDERFALGCTSGGFTDYFAPARWEATTIKGDGGVDVTGAPNPLLVEGANNALVKVATQSLVQWQIAVPAEGYIAFGWRAIGGSNLFQVLVNGQSVIDSTDNAEAHTFFSPLLKTGDRFTLQLRAGKSEEAQTEISDFRFYTNAIATIARHWKATDDNGESTRFTQIIAIERTSLSDVIFPADYDDHGIQAFGKPGDISPATTGYPVADRDGNPATTTDQSRIDQCDCGYVISWNDEGMTNGFDCLIIRHWLIEDICGGSTMKQNQVIKLTNGAPDCQPAGVQPPQDTLEGARRLRGSGEKALSATTEKATGRQ